MRGSRIIIPSCLRLELFDSIHKGHQGIGKCRERAKQYVWWPGLATQIADLVYKCSTCSHGSREIREPLISGGGGISITPLAGYWHRSLLF
ncbi:hypothetical protein HOLleu_29680 [Holothuria leucospilota]|uniref:Integrase zinc-binding domain-containing protein n=1 Tax=Holothuria leucospilota TaxID=206669 RepID=A0A9Q1GYH5_HOLLE|nr:hypothetical protein HOLleu_29680 [Holothuria leucospilota]